MRALTFWRPWDWLVLHGHKPVENRRQRIPEHLVGVPVAVHAGSYYDSKLLAGPVPAGAPLAPSGEPFRIGGLVVFDGWVAGANGHGGRRQSRGLTEDAAREYRDSPWYAGRDDARVFGWHVAERFVLPDPVAGVLGMQGFWRLPEWALERVLQQLAPEWRVRVWRARERAAGERDREG